MKRYAKAVAQRLALGIVTVSMVFSSVPLTAFADNAADETTTPAIVANSDDSSEGTDASGSTTLDTTPWYDKIDEMLDTSDPDTPSYTEGDVIATVVVEHEGDSGNSLGYDSEDLYWSTGDAYENATGHELGENALMLAKAWYDKDVTSSCDVNLVHVLIHSDTSSTREILLGLKERAGIEGVVYAEPNYELSNNDDLYDADATDSDQSDDAAEDGLSASEDESADEGNTEIQALAANTTTTTATQSYTPTTDPQDVTSTANATSLQWAYGNTTNYKNLYSALSSIKLTTWNQKASKNASGVVAVVDTGIDYTHPDLKSVMFDMSKYKDMTVTYTSGGSTVTAKVGGGMYGYNAVDTSNQTNPADDNGHGTHVAGIVAAEYNGYGVSGTANGAQLLAVKAASKYGNLKTSNLLKAYQYLKRVKKAGVDLRVVNNSWTGTATEMSSALYTAIYDLGADGVLSVFASGNKSVNVDNEKYTPTALLNNPYVLVVNSLDMNGAVSGYTNRGAKTTDVYAPGSCIMSTTPTSFEGTYVPSIMGGVLYNTFNNGTLGGIKVLAKDSGTTSTIGAYASDASFDTGTSNGCLNITGRELMGCEPSDLMEPHSKKKKVVMKIPVTEAQLKTGFSEIGMAVNLSGIAKSPAWLEVLASDGTWLTNDNWFKTELELQTLYDSNWSTLSLNLTNACKLTKKSVGVFSDEDGLYIEVAVCLNYPNGLNVDANSSLKIDCIGLGNKAWHYGYKSGTSQATPLVSGLASIVYRSLDLAGTNVESSVKTQKVANIICSAVTQNSAYVCSTKGRVNASNYSSAITADKSTPYIGSVSAGEVTRNNKTYKTLTVTGANLMTNGGFDKLYSLSTDDWVMDKSSTDQKVVLLMTSLSGYKSTTFTLSESAASANSETAAYQSNCSFTISTLCTDDSNNSGGSDDPSDDNGTTDDSDSTGGKTDTGSDTNSTSEKTDDDTSEGTTANTGSSAKQTASTKKATVKAMPATGDDQMGIVAVIAVAGAACIAAAIVIIVRQRKR